jgi:hypothetical protein
MHTEHLIEKTEEKTSFGRPRCKREVAIKNELEEM